MKDISIVRDMILSDVDLSTLDKDGVDEEWVLLNKQYHIINVSYLELVDEIDAQRKLVRTLRWQNAQIWASHLESEKVRRQLSKEKNEERKAADAVLSALKKDYAEYRLKFGEIARRRTLIKAAWDRLRIEKKSLVEQQGMTKAQEYRMNRLIRQAKRDVIAAKRNNQVKLSTHEERMADVRDRLNNRGKYALHEFVGTAEAALCDRCNYSRDRYPHYLEEEE
jgi:hypothetical protein